MARKRQKKKLSNIGGGIKFSAVSHGSLTTHSVPTGAITRSKKAKEREAKREAKRRAREERKEQAQTLLSMQRAANQALKERSQLLRSEAEFTRSKEIINQLADIANYRVRELHREGLESYALYKAQEGRVDDGRIDEFSVRNIKDVDALMTEATRIRSFLQDPTSTVFGARRIQEQDAFWQWVGEFGNQYAGEHYDNKKFNIYTIREDVAKVAFKSYRMLEELAAARIQEYGSEYVIAYLYDIALSGGNDDPEDFQALNELALRGRDYLERVIGVKDYIFSVEFEDELQTADAKLKWIKHKLNYKE